VTIRVTLCAAFLIAGVGAATAQMPKMDFSNSDLAPQKGRVGIKAKSGTLGQDMLACPEPGLLRMVIKGKDQDRAQTLAANSGCFDLSKGDHVEIADRMPLNDEPASHLCVKLKPTQSKCMWMLNVGVKAD
jgi:hypothetical protein